jgi:hypothetical protein
LANRFFLFEACFVKCMVGPSERCKKHLNGNDFTLGKEGRQEIMRTRKCGAAHSDCVSFMNDIATAFAHRIDDPRALRALQQVQFDAAPQSSPDLNGELAWSINSDASLGMNF